MCIYIYISSFPNFRGREVQTTTVDAVKGKFEIACLDLGCFQRNHLLYHTLLLPSSHFDILPASASFDIGVSPGEESWPSLAAASVFLPYTNSFCIFIILSNRLRTPCALTPEIVSELNLVLTVTGITSCFCCSEM